MSAPLDILVVEDTERHIEEAKSKLAAHNVTYVTNYCDAMEQLKTNHFNIVLTDLHIPFGKIRYPISIDMMVGEDPAAQGVEYHELRTSPKTEALFEQKTQVVLTKPEPLGYAIALYAKMFAQVPDVAIVTDVNHHSGIFAATLDDFDNYQSQPSRPQYNGFAMMMDSKYYGEALECILEKKFYI